MPIQVATIITNPVLMAIVVLFNFSSSLYLPQKNINKQNQKVNKIDCVVSVLNVRSIQHESSSCGTSAS